MTPLGRKIAIRIRADGPMTIAEYMTTCLADPEHGYYMAREPFGRAGDFVTAPEISQMFGELIGAWIGATWLAMKRPAPVVVAELGPGRGTLMKDALRMLAIVPGFLAAARFHLVETSARLRRLQAEMLASARVEWHDRVDDLPLAPTILVANEFFDALPIRQFVASPSGFAERMVGLDAAEALTFGLRPAAPLPAVRRAPPGALVEVSPASTAVMATIAARLAEHGGAALVIDYGYQGPAVGDTLQAVRRHAYDDPLAAPGEADLTAHVDFGALAAAAEAGGARPRPLIDQGAFLMRLGLAERAERLARGKDDTTRAAIATAARRLAAPDAMGRLFKVLAISRPGLALPAFDADA